MIIFEIDDVLADTSHRRHLIDGKHSKNVDIPKDCYGLVLYQDNKGNVWNPKTIDDFKPDYAAYNAACFDDRPITQLFHIMYNIDLPFEIWTSRCESTREITWKWLRGFLSESEMPEIKMRPVGDDTPIDRLKEQWYDLHNVENPRQNIDMVFASDPDEIKMWKRRGVFVFDCNQRE